MPASETILISRHSRQSRYSAAARQPNHHGFPLIVGVMRCHQGPRIDFTHVIKKQPVTRAASLGLNSRRRLLACPDQDGVRNVQCPRPLRNFRRLVNGFRPEPMVHGCGGQRRVAALSRHAAANRNSAIESGPPETAIKSPEQRATAANSNSGSKSASLAVNTPLFWPLETLLVSPQLMHAGTCGGVRQRTRRLVPSRRAH